jgi:hypothetical protein
VNTEAEGLEIDCDCWTLFIGPFIGGAGPHHCGNLMFYFALTLPRMSLSLHCTTLYPILRSGFGNQLHPLPLEGASLCNRFFFLAWQKLMGINSLRKISEAAAWDPNSQRPAMGPPSCAKSWTEALHHVHHVLAVDHVVIFEPL